MFAYDSVFAARVLPPRMKRRKSDQIASRKKAKTEATSNPFEVKINRKKHDILGQKSKSDRGLPGVARSKGIKKVYTFLIHVHVHYVYLSLELRTFPLHVKCMHIYVCHNMHVHTYYILYLYN